MPELEIQDRAWVPAACRAESFDAESRTVQVVFATQEPVRRRTWAGEEYDEVLSVDSKSVRLDRLNGGAAVLNSHAAQDLASVVGAVVPGSAKLRNGQATCTIRFSGRDDVAGIVRDVRDGILRSVSVGYRIHKTEKTEGRAGSVPVVRAVDWEPFEVSIVPIPADPGAHIRADKTQTKGATMPEVESAAQPQASARFGRAERRALAARFLPADAVESFVSDHSRGDESAYRAALLDHLAERQEGTEIFPYVDVYANNRNSDMLGLMAEAVAHRANPTLRLSNEAREFAGLRFSDMARRILEAGGSGTRGESPSQVVTRALHTTSDFPLLLGDTVGRTLLPAYQAASSGLKRLARQASAPDFRRRSKFRLSEAGELKKVNEAGEFTRSTFSESGEGYALATYGRVFGITRQALVNDDLSAFSDIAVRLGAAAARFEEQHLTALLEANPVMSDGKSVFHVDHANLASGLAAKKPGVDSLSAARLAMRKQTGLAGERIAVAPRFLVVPPDLETVAEQLLADLAAATVEEQNPFSGKLELVVNPYMTSDQAWYLAAAPELIAGLEYAYLEGNEGPQIETRNGFDVDGVEIKVRLDYGAGWIDHRGWFRNDGQ
jgi:hypothetical protein